ncbi:MAG TPA: exodeoxyribonuclease VII small subunit [Acidimicrobiales bacterium]|nr:exodeoxyribonuclease VII small subunit [Acidimicrobiales bacterium]
MAQKNVSDLGYSEAASELDRIIEELDQGQVDLDVLESRFQRAVEIVEELDRRIRGAKERVDELLPRLAALATGDDEDDA